MKRIKIHSIIFFWLSLVGVPVALGANPPSGRAKPAPLRQEAAPGDLLSLDLHVYIAAKPIYFILVEKDRQRLRVLRHDGRLQVVAEFAAATGENLGPKEKEGDSKTPEGVYFITKAYLDRKVSVFGTRAFHLNYPNYFDLRAGRAGYGIYIHGTNRSLRFNSSNGCVTLKNSDLDRLADFLNVGTPIFIVPSLNTRTDGKGEYPNLTEHNFDGAKALLIPDAAAQTDFANLYLIRINGQTVIAGEYWADQASSQPQLTLAYLQGSTGNRWSVVDRGPAASGPREQDEVTIASLPLTLGWRLTDRSAEDSVWSSDEPLPWQMPPEERYLAWDREPRPSGMLPDAGLRLGAVSSAPEPAAIEAAGMRAGKVYGIFFIATGISIGSALVLIRRQLRSQGNHGGGKAAANKGSMGDGDQGAAQVVLLRDEVKQAIGALHTVQKRIDQEAMNVESLEELQARMNALEWTFQDKQAAIDQLSVEQAALKSAGMAERSDQAETLNSLQQELSEVTQRLEEARQAMVFVADREETVHDQLTELRRLAELELASKKGEEIQEVMTVCASLRGQVQAMAEAWQGSEQSRRQEREESGRGTDEVTAALQAYAAEMKGLQLEMAAIKGVADSSGLEAVLQGLRSELREEQTTKLELMSQLGRMSLLEEELATRNRENQTLQQESEERLRQTVAEKLALETALEALRQEVSTGQAEKSELTSRLAGISELEEELAGLNRENETLRKRNEEQRVDAEAARVALESTLEALRQELRGAQAEKSDLTDRLACIAALEAELSGRDQEIFAVRQEGEARCAQAVAEKIELELAQESLLHELQAAQAEKAEFSGRLARIAELDAEVAGREQEIEAVRQEGEARYAQAVAEKAELAAALESFRQELSTAQGEKSELLGRLARINELETELSGRDQEIEAVRQEGEARYAQAVAEKIELELAQESLRLELSAAQAEKSVLSARLARIAELDAELAGHDQEIEAVRQEGEARYAQAVSEKAGLAAALASLQHDLQAAQDEKSELAAHLTRISELEAELNGRDQEIEAVRQEGEARYTEAVAEKIELELAQESLRLELSAAQADKSAQAARLARSAELEAELAIRDQEIEALRQEGEARQAQAVAEKTELASALELLRHELAGAQGEKSELAARLARINELEAELSGRDQEIEALRQEGEARYAEAVAEKIELELGQESLRHELRTAQAEQSGLAARLTRIAELDAELAARDQEIEALRQEGETRQAQAVAEKTELVSTVELLQHELSGAQEEKSELTHRLARLNDLEAALSTRNQEIEALRQEGAARDALTVTEKMELESSLESLRHELNAAEAAKSELTTRLVRISELEEDLARRNREIELLREGSVGNDSEAAKRQLEVALESLRQELREEKAAKSELMNRLGRIGELEEELAAARNREAEALRAASEERATEKRALESAIDSLRQELNDGQAVRSSLEHRLLRISELEAELSGRSQELERARELNEERAQAAAAEKSRLDLRLDSLQNELQEEQRSKLELMSRLSRITELEEELASRNLEVVALQDDSEERQVEDARQKGQLESALASLQEERSLRDELSSRLGRISELEEELAVRNRETEALRQANEATAGDSTAEKSRLEANLAEIVLARQVEVASLSSALQEAKDKALAEQDAVRSLTSEVETLRESLRQMNEQQEQEQEAVIAELRQEVLTLKSLVVELEKKASATDGVVMVKGSHYLPGDVLRKWIGKE